MTFGLDAAEAEKKYRNVCTAYCRYLKKSVPSASGRDAAEFNNLDWFNNLDSSHKVCSPIDIRHFVYESCAKIPLSDPRTL